MNDVPIVEAPLKDGDKILLGKLPLTFSRSLEGKVVLDEEQAALRGVAGTIIRSVGELSKLLDSAGRASEAAPGAQKPATLPTSRRSRSPTAS